MVEQLPYCDSSKLLLQSDLLGYLPNKLGMQIISLNYNEVIVKA